MKLLENTKYKIIIIAIIFACIIIPKQSVLASSTEGNRIAAKGAELACGTSPIYVEHAYTKINDPIAKKYISTRDSVISGRSPDGGDYASCDIAVATIIRSSGVDPNFHPFYVYDQLDYLKANSDKWRKIGLYKKGSSTKDLKPGDVMIVDNDYNTSKNKYQHIWLYLGKQAVKNGDYDSIQASYSDYPNSSYYPTLFSAEAPSNDNRTYVIYRYNGEDVIQQIINWGNYVEKNKYEYSDDVCAMIKGDVQDFLNIMFIIISIIGIILLIIVTIVEYVKAMTSSDEDSLKTAFKHTLIRVVCIIILLILPMLISWILNVVNDNFSGNYKIGEDGKPLCEIGNKN